MKIEITEASGSTTEMVQAVQRLTERANHANRRNRGAAKSRKGEAERKKSNQNRFSKSMIVGETGKAGEWGERTETESMAGSVEVRVRAFTTKTTTTKQATE